jgi:hypothetical protein
MPLSRLGIGDLVSEYLRRQAGSGLTDRTRAALNGLLSVVALTTFDRLPCGRRAEGCGKPDGDVPSRPRRCSRLGDTRVVLDGVTGGKVDLALPAPSGEVEFSVRVTGTADLVRREGRPVLTLADLCPERCVDAWVQGIARADVTFAFEAGAEAARALRDLGLPFRLAQGSLTVPVRKNVFTYRHTPTTATFVEAISP